MPAARKAPMLTCADDVALVVCAPTYSIAAADDATLYRDDWHDADVIMRQARAYDEEQHSAESDATHALLAVACAQDRATCDHSTRMMHLAEATAVCLGRSDEERRSIRLAALLHDIGKIAIPSAIRHKPGPLTSEEWGVMRRHPETGRHMLWQVGGDLDHIAPIVAAHHERWDGLGYPHRLAATAIPLGARILAVVDSFDAMTSPRPYRAPITIAAARAELLCGIGSQYDPTIVIAFLDMLADYPIH